ncbi:MAG TPA: L7Ae/L30e/S12e/Gadd45 family ribosomal protein [Verrucomicrobiae bacterium]|nr:L7Ae/L30e/S12e/Gadd45 family ribosomal protein [Verrucomicrobiae bacterium]
MNDKVTALLGFASKAKKLVSGESAVDAILKKGQARLIILAEDVSPNFIRKYTLWCKDEDVPVLSFGTKISLGIAVGLSPRGVIAVTDENFAQGILNAGGFSAKKSGS